MHNSVFYRHRTVLLSGNLMYLLNTLKILFGCIKEMSAVDIKYNLDNVVTKTWLNKKKVNFT